MDVLKGSGLHPSLMQIHVSGQHGADAAWRMLNAVLDELFQPVELHLTGHGPLYRVVRDGNGDQTAVPVAAEPGHSSPA